MAHSHVDFGDKSFRAHDLDLAVTCALILDAYREVIPDSMQKMFGAWMESITNDGPGCIDLGLDQYLTDDYVLSEFCRLIDSVQESLRKYPHGYPAPMINGLLRATKISIENDYNVSNIRGVLDGFRTLLKE